MRTIATFSNPEQAHFLRTRLESAGIAAWVLDENMVQMDWMLGLAIGGVRVQVEEADLADARSLLAAERELPAPESGLLCTACGAAGAVIDNLWQRIALAGLLFLHLPIWPPRERWRCRTCGHTFDLKETGTDA